MISRCDPGEVCFSVGGVQVTRLATNRFAFHTSDSRGFTMNGLTVINRTHDPNPIDADYYRHFQFELMRGITQ